MSGSVLRARASAGSSEHSSTGDCTFELNLDTCVKAEKHSTVPGSVGSVPSEHRFGE